MLHDAAFYGHLAIVQELVKDLKHINPGAEGFDYRTPWHEAAFGGSLRIIKFYYKMLPDITITDANAWNAIHYAAFKGSNVASCGISKFLSYTAMTPRLHKVTK